MTRYNTNPQLLTPPREEEEIYPYRRVWPSIIIEMALLFAVAAGLYLASAFLGVGVPAGLRAPVNVGLALLPAGLWLIFSYLPERRVPEPRRRLLPVIIISALVANAIGKPIIDFIDVGQWLSTADTIQRWIGYATTIGIVYEALKYIIVRQLIWPDDLRNRLDAAAYGAACAVGYATMLNLQFLAEGAIASDVVAIRVFSTTAFHVAASIVVAYGLGDTRFNRRSLVVLPLTMILAAVVHGIALPTRSSLARAGFALGISGSRPVFSLGFSLVVIVGALVTMIFLFRAAERQEREAAASQET